MIDFPAWSTAVWINIGTSICVAACIITWIAFAWVRRGQLNNVQDRERWSITAVLMMLVLFFTTRAVDVGRAGMTIATPWLLTSGVLLSVSCVICTVIVIRSHGEYGVLNQPPWKPGDPERRSGKDRRRSTYERHISD
jgi:hypothetical protein